MLFALKYDDVIEVDALLDRFWENFRFSEDALGEPLNSLDQPVAESVRVFAERLVRGIADARPALDQTINKVVQNWSLTRMTPVDLSILRMACYELYYMPDIPLRVTLNEAIEIAKRYGTKESPSFVNGLLDKIAKNIDKPDN